MKSYKIALMLLLCATHSFADKEMIIDLTEQRIYAIEDGEVVIESRVSTGKKGYDTPAGNFKILEKQVHHISNIYNLPMPFMMRLTNYGVAIHQGYVPDYPASHGCIRVPRDYAGEIFDWAPVGTPVYIKYNVDYAALGIDRPRQKTEFGRNESGSHNKRVTIDDFL
jgi:hypothetical protein